MTSVANPTTGQFSTNVSSGSDDNNSDTDEMKSPGSTGEPDVETVSVENPKPSRLEFKRLDKVRLDGSSEWNLLDTSHFTDKTTPKAQTEYGRYAKYNGQLFIVRRKVVPSPRDPNTPIIITRILIWDPSLKDALHPVLQHVPGLSWKVAKLKLDPLTLVAFFPYLSKRQEELESSVKDEDRKMASYLKFLIDFIAKEHEASLQKIRELVSFGEITFDLLWGLIIPRTVVFITCPTTSEPRAVRVKNMSKCQDMQGNVWWSLKCEYLEVNEESRAPEDKFGMADMTLSIPQFSGVVKIHELSIFPIEWHPQRDAIKATLIDRARKWVQHDGTHHVQYTGLGYRASHRFQVNGRIVIDRGTFAHFNPDYGRRTVERNRSGHLFRMLFDTSDDSDDEDQDQSTTYQSAKKPRDISTSVLSDDDLLLASPILFGFSLVDKCWLEFNINHVKPIQWNDKCIENLAIDADQKLLLQSLINAHAKGEPVDDFIQGKGLGLVFNLFGPPGLGKSFTVEAVSEYLHRPVYVVSGGDLGTTAATLDGKLKNIFDLSPIWNAIVLIDEADVFLEERSSINLERNAMVAVFLRQIEYFRGILFLTTNRVQSFDQAFQSRIHLSLSYPGLSDSARAHLWSAFFANACSTLNQKGKLSELEMQQLLQYDLNGRQIKNTVKVAASVAGYKGEVLSFQHISHTLKTMKELRSAKVAEPATALTILRTRFWDVCSYFIPPGKDTVTI